MSSADPEAIVAATAQLGRSRRYLAPVGWAAGTVGLMLGGIKLLIFNWRLSLLELPPALCIWLGMWDLEQHFLYGMEFQQVNNVTLAVVWVAVALFTILALACNTVFAFAIDGPPPPRILPAARQAKAVAGRIVGWGAVLGVLMASAVVIVPRVLGLGWFGIILGGVLALLMTAFVAIPARLIGFQKHTRTMKQRVSSYAVGGALSAVAVAPGYLVARLGLVLMGLSTWAIVGFMLVTVGTALYAAGLSAARAVKLGSKLIGSPARDEAAPAPGQAT